MIHLTCNSNILIATQHADFRQGIDGLAALCKQRLSTICGQIHLATTRKNLVAF